MSKESSTRSGQRWICWSSTRTAEVGSPKDRAARLAKGVARRRAHTPSAGLGSGAE